MVTKILLPTSEIFKSKNSIAFTMGLVLLSALFNVAIAQNEFITTWRTTTANETITIPTTGTGYNYSVDWGDGTTETGFTGNASHAYSSAGDYVVKITGNFPRIYFNNNADSDKIISIDQWGDIAWTSFESAFNDCRQLQILATDAPDLSNVTSLFDAFRACRAIGSPDLSNWDVSTVTNMSGVFFFTNFNGNVTTWDVGSVTDFSLAFAQTSINQDITGWNIGERVTGNIIMAQMFAFAKSFDQDISVWDMSKVSDALQMLRSTDSFDYDLGGWDISSIAYMTDFLNGAGLSAENYDSTLIGWATLDTGSGETKIPTGITFNGGNSAYCTGQNARNTLTSAPYNWVITDGGRDCNPPIITLNGNNPQTIAVGNGYTELGATSDDGSEIIIDSSEFVDAVGTYTILYSATDTSGYTTLAKRTVNVVDPNSQSGNALDFDGVDDVVTVANNSALEFATGIIEVWIKPDWVSGTAGYNPSFLGIRDNSGSRFSFHIKNDYSGLDLYNGNVGSLYYSFVQGQWYHITLEMKATETVIYINGVQEGIIDLGVNTSVTGKNLNIGSSNGSGEYFKGEIDDIRIWSGDKTYCETVLYKDTGLTGSEDGLIAYYNFDQGTAGGNNPSVLSLLDSSSNSLNGSLLNFARNGSTSNWVVSGTQPFFYDTCYTYVPDDNFEQELINLGYDTDLNDYVLTEKINSLTSLYISDRNILDLTGIADFEALESLWVRGNGLTELNLSSNLELNSLYAGYNSLSSIDLSVNTNLTRLGLEGNGLEHMVLPVSASGLYEFNVSGNNLTEINLNSYPNLLLVVVNDNPLLERFSLKNGNNSAISDFESINTPLLSCIEVDDAAYSTANWTNVDAHTSFNTSCMYNYTYVPDDNFEQRLIDLGYDDVLDDYVLTANINTVTFLNVERKSIVDLTGIEGFVALEVLESRYNSLTTVDISQNVELTEVLFGNNDLTTLDLSTNNKLIYLAAESNELTEIVFPSVPIALRTVQLNNNNFVQLDLSSLSNLLILKLNDNALLKELNIKNGNNIGLNGFETLRTPSLFCIEVDDPAYSTANWTNIDAQTSFSVDCLYDYTYVPDDNFEQALIDLGYDSVLDDYVLTDNIDDVASLNVSSKNISVLTGIEDFAALVTLNCRSNNLIALDLSSNLQLTNLICGANNFSSLDLRGNTNLNVLAAEINALSEIQLPQGIEYLNISANEFTELDLSIYPDLNYLEITSNPFLELLNVKNGNNTNFTNFNALSNPLLYCIEVDDPSFSTANWTNIDAHTSFRVECTAPVITLTGDNPQTIELGDGYTELGATADDGSDIVIDDSEFMDAVGSYTIYYDATDAAGNDAVQVTRTVNVVDTTAPVITLTGDNPQTIELGDGYTELGATTDDGSDIVIDASEFMDAVGTYTIYYDATDASGNDAVQVTRTVNIVDTTAPVITLTGANPQIIELGVGYSELGATTDDGSDIVIEASEFMDVVGGYTIYYDAVDTSGNDAVQVTRTVNVVDTTAPIANCARENYPLYLDETGNLTISASTIDNGSSDLSGIKSISIDRDTFDCSDLGNPVSVTLTVTDNNDLVSTCTTTVMVYDEHPPVFDTNTLPVDVVVGYNNAENNGYIIADFTEQIVATDNCSATVRLDQYPAPGFVVGRGTRTITIEAWADDIWYSLYEFTLTVDETLSIEDNVIEGLLVYPVPAKDIVYLSIEVDKAEVVNITGQKVKELNTTSTIDLSELPQGVYFARIEKDDKQDVIRLVKN